MPKQETVRMAPGDKFPLLTYRRYHTIHRGVSILLIVLGLAVTGTVLLYRTFGPGKAGVDTSLLLWAGLAVLILGIVRFLFTWFVSRSAYVQCTPRNVKIQTPFMPIVFSYKRILATRPNAVRDLWKPDKQKGSRRAILEGLWGETMIVVDLKGLPMSRSTIRLIAGPFLLTPSGTGFVFLVQDWMGLNRQLADYQEKWRARTSTTPTPAQRGQYARR